MTLFRFLLLVVLMPWLGALAQDPWDGVWETRWRGAGALLYLEQEGEQVTGTYPLYSGKISASVEGSRLSGSWTQDDGSGYFVFELSPDGQSFSGRFESGEWWTGRRISDRGEYEAPKARRDSPRSTLKSFLNAANASRSGFIEQIAPALACVEYSKVTKGSVSTSDRLDAITLLFEVMDECLFRMFDLPGVEDPELAKLDHWQLMIQQDGTELSYPLDFVKRDGVWLIQAPSRDDLESMLKALLKRKGGQRPTARSYVHRASPRDAVRCFLESFDKLHHSEEELVLDCLDLKHLGAEPRRQEARLLAMYLKQVMDRAGFVIYQEIPDDPHRVDPYVHFHHPVGEIVLMAVQVGEEGSQRSEWRFSDATLRNIRELFTAMEGLPPVSHHGSEIQESLFFKIRSTMQIDAPLLLRSYRGIEFWQILAMLLSIIFSLLLARVASSFLVWYLHKRNTFEEALKRRSIRRRMLFPIQMTLSGLFLYWSLGLIGFPEGLSLVLRNLFLSLSTISLAWLTFRGIGLATRINNQNLQSETRNHKGVLVALLLGILRVFSILFVAILLADIWSIPYTSILTGLGIGGVAVALATQGTLQNIISGFTLFADRPVSVGDFCKYNGQLGTVEQIGLRSVRIRTLDRSLISMPTQQFADMQLENLAARDRLLLKFVIGVRYETTAEQLRFLQANIRKMLLGHPEILPDPARVRFSAFGAYSLDLEIFCYVRGSDWSNYLGVKEDIHLRIMDIVEEAGTGFAFPSSTTYLARDGGVDEEKQEEAEREVQRWRKLNKLPQPDYSDEALEEMEDELEYPPEGSARRPVDPD